MIRDTREISFKFNTLYSFPLFYFNYKFFDLSPFLLFRFSLFKQALQIQKWYALHVLCKCRYKSNMYMTFLFQNVICDIYIYIRFFVIFCVIDFFCVFCFIFFICIQFCSFAYIFFYQEFQMYFREIYSNMYLCLILPIFKIVTIETRFENSGNFTKLKSLYKYI